MLLHARVDRSLVDIAENTISQVCPDELIDDCSRKEVCMSARIADSTSREPLKTSRERDYDRMEICIEVSQAGGFIIQVPVYSRYVILNKVAVIFVAVLRLC